MLLLPTLVRQTAHGYSPELWKRSRPVPQIMTFVFPAYILNPFFSMASFHIKSLLTHSSRESAMMTRSSAYRSSQGTLARNSCDKASSTMMKGKGLSTDPWWTLTFTSNSLLKPSPTRSLQNEIHCRTCKWTLIYSFYNQKHLSCVRHGKHCYACPLLTQLRPEGEINMRRAPYELVPGPADSYDRCYQRSLREYVHLRNIVRVSLLTNNIKFEVDGDLGQINSRHVRTLC